MKAATPLRMSAYPVQRGSNNGYEPRSASHYNRSLPDGRSSADVPENSSNTKDQVVRVAILSEIAIDPGAEFQCFGVTDSFGGSDDGTNRPELVKRFGRAVLVSRSRSDLPVT
jgi:hypothetical protein